jgi:hypothetical protein
MRITRKIIEDETAEQLQTTQAQLKLTRTSPCGDERNTNML